MTRVEFFCHKCEKWTEIKVAAAGFIISWGGGWIFHCKHCDTAWEIRVTFKEVKNDTP